MDEHDKRKLISPWVPMKSAVDKKHIGKLLEELGEGTAAASRCLIQGISAKEPITGKLNKEWLEDKLADIIANIELNVEHFKLNKKRMGQRVATKKRSLRIWHQMLTSAGKKPQYY